MLKKYAKSTAIVGKLINATELLALLVAFVTLLVYLIQTILLYYANVL